MPIFVKVLGIALGVAVILGAGLLWQIHQTWRAHLVRELDERGQRLASQLSLHCAELSRAGLAGDLAAEFQHTLTESVDVAYLVFRDRGGAVLAEARAAGEDGNPDRIREFTAPVGHGPHSVQVGMSTLRLDQDVAWLTRRLARLTAIITLLGMLGAWALARLFARPRENLVQLTRAIKAGDYSVRAPVQAADEVGELATAFNDMTEAIALKETARQKLLRQVIHAGEEERRRIARELHDHTGQALTSQIAALSALESQTADDRARQRLRELRQQTEQTLAEVHDLSVDLRPSVLDDYGLAPALERHCRSFAQRAGIAVRFQALGLEGGRLPPETELTIYRVAQEALTNAVRHGRATEIRLFVFCTEASVCTTISDNGCGFDAQEWQQRFLGTNHLGLVGIEERVTLLGGSFCVESEPGKGAAVYADIPLGRTA